MEYGVYSHKPLNFEKNFLLHPVDQEWLHWNILENKDPKGY
jgi:hypothetical protein